MRETLPDSGGRSSKKDCIQKRDASMFVRTITPTLIDLTRIFAKVEMDGVDNIPRDRGAVLMPNHISHVDPVYLDGELYRRGILVHNIAKKSIFDVPLVGRFMRGAGQVAVDRKGHPADALEPAIDIVKKGGILSVYAEGTTTRTKSHFPKPDRLKTGSARIAADANVPIIPVAQWGAQHLFDPSLEVDDDGAKRSVSLGERLRDINSYPTISIRFGEPIEPSELGLTPESNADDYRAATKKIMGIVAVMMSEISGEPLPEEWQT